MFLPPFKWLLLALLLNIFIQTHRVGTRTHTEAETQTIRNDTNTHLYGYCAQLIICIERNTDTHIIKEQKRIHTNTGMYIQTCSD